MTPQEKTILNHLKDRTITAMESVQMYGIYRLSARIYNLRQLGYNIVSHRMRTAEGKNFAKYQLI